MAQETFLYVTDVGNNRAGPYLVFKYDENGENGEVFIDTQLSRPQDIVFIEEQGIALVSNLQTNNITSYDATTGEFLGVWASGIGQPTRMEFGDDGLLYVLQWAGDGLVRRYDTDGNFVGNFTSVGVNQAIGIDWDSEGNLYVSSFNGAHVRKFDQNGNDLGTIATTGLQGPTNLWFDATGEMLVLDWSGRAVRRYSAAGIYIDNFATGLGEPEGIEFLPNGDVLIGIGTNGSVAQYQQPDGSFVQRFVESGAAGLVKPNGLRFRTLSGFELTAGMNGNWWGGLARNGEGAQVEIANGGGGTLVFVATIYSYNQDGEQIFLIAVGEVDGDTAEVDVFITDGGRWGEDFDPNDVVETQWGTGTFTGIDCDNLEMSLMPNAEFQAQGFTDLAYTLERLTTSVIPCP